MESLTTLKICQAALPYIHCILKISLYLHFQTFRSIPLYLPVEILGAVLQRTPSLWDLGHHVLELSSDQFSCHSVCVSVQQTPINTHQKI